MHDFVRVCVEAANDALPLCVHYYINITCTTARPYTGSLVFSTANRYNLQGDIKFRSFYDLVKLTFANRKRSSVFLFNN